MKIEKHTDISRDQAEYKTSIEAFFFNLSIFFLLSSVQNSHIFHRFFKSFVLLWKINLEETEFMHIV